TAPHASATSFVRGPICFSEPGPLVTRAKRVNSRNSMVLSRLEFSCKRDDISAYPWECHEFEIAKIGCPFRGGRDRQRRSPAGWKRRCGDLSCRCLVAGHCFQRDLKHQIEPGHAV